MNIEDLKNLKIPTTPGSYQFKNENDEIIYVGKAARLNSRVLSYWQKSTNHSPAKFSMMKQIKKVEWIETDSEIEALLLESNLIKKYQPYYNVDKKDDKRYSYIKISTEDEIPGIFITKTIDRSGKYFGPFVSSGALKETLKAIRKIWPYCTERKVKKKACFYAQINKCTGVCGGEIELKNYKEKIIKPIILFFEGKKERIVKNYELKIKYLEKLIKQNLATEEQLEELRKLKFEIFNMKNVLEHTSILGLMDKFATDVIELAKVLGLPKTPNRIEGYDISNIFGKDAVGSMVVFQEGEPEKSEYKRFKIKIEDNTGDTGMLKEVIERRIKHVEKEGIRFLPEAVRNRIPHQIDKWSDPDLIIIDGGKGQLNVVSKILKKNKLEIPVIAISKGLGLRSAKAPDKLFFPGEKKPLELPLSSPALHLIKRVRDEAHRFAIQYHRSIRKKKFLKK